MLKGRDRKVKSYLLRLGSKEITRPIQLVIPFETFIKNQQIVLLYTLRLWCFLLLHCAALLKLHFYVLLHTSLTSEVKFRYGLSIQLVCAFIPKSFCNNLLFSILFYVLWIMLKKKKTFANESEPWNSKFREVEVCIDSVSSKWIAKFKSSGISAVEKCCTKAS